MHYSVGRVLALARESPQPAPVLTPLTACDALRAQMLVVLLEAGLARALVFAAMSPAAAHPLLQRAAAAELQYIVALSMRLLPSPHAGAAWNLPDLVQVRAQGLRESVFAHFRSPLSLFPSGWVAAYCARRCTCAAPTSTWCHGPVCARSILGCGCDSGFCRCVIRSRRSASYKRPQFMYFSSSMSYPWRDCQDTPGCDPSPSPSARPAPRCNAASAMEWAY